jgi:hypothetical protein
MEKIWQKLIEIRNNKAIDVKPLEYLLEKIVVKMLHFYLLPKIRKLGKILETIDPIINDRNIHLLLKCTRKVYCIPMQWCNRNIGNVFGLFLSKMGPNRY